MGLIMNKCHALWFILLGNYWGIIVHHPTRAPNVLPGSHPLKPCTQSHLIGWQSLEGLVLTSHFSLFSSMNKAFSDYIKQGLFNCSQPWLHPGNRELPWARGQAVGRRVGAAIIHNFTPLLLHGSWIEPLDLTGDWSKIDNEKWEEQGERIIDMMLTDRWIYF